MQLLPTCFRSDAALSGFRRVVLMVVLVMLLLVLTLTKKMWTVSRV